MTQRNELECRLHGLRAHVVVSARTRTCLIDGLARENAERDRDRQRRRELSQRSRDRVGEDVEVRGLTSYQAAERHDGVEASRSREHRDRRRQLERAGHLELLDLRALGERGLNGTLGERSRDLFVPARPDDRHPRAGLLILSPSRSLPSSGHLSQSSPRMRHSPVSR
jgi:hypothetical protein